MRREGLAMALLCTGLGGCALPVAYDEPPPMPAPLSPAVGASLVVDTPTRFVWAPVKRAAHYDFHLFDRETRDIERYYRAALDPAEVCRGEAGEEGAECAVTLSVALPYLEGHAWRVRAGNNAGKSGWTRREFTMVDGAGAGPGAVRRPAMPVPIAPGRAAAVVRGSLVTFEWTPSADATGYDFHLFDRSDGEIADQVLELSAATVCRRETRCSFARTVRLPTGDGHAWRVRALNRHGRSEWTRTELSVVASGR